jgi:hypothetical protein
MVATRFIASMFLLLIGYYLLPEHYLLPFHPHEHDIHCCEQSQEFDGAVFKPSEKVCLEKENYKQIYYFALVYYKSIAHQPVNILTPELHCAIVSSSYKSTQTRAPPSIS